MDEPSERIGRWTRDRLLVSVCFGGMCILRRRLRDVSQCCSRSRNSSCTTNKQVVPGKAGGPDKCH